MSSDVVIIIGVSIISISVIAALSIALFVVFRKNKKLQELQKNLVEADQVEQHKDAYKRSRQDLQLTIDAFPLPTCIIGSRDAFIYYENNAFKDCFRFPIESSEHGIWDRMPETQSNGESSRKVIVRFIQSVLQSQTPATGEQEYLNSTGGTVLMHVVGTKINYQEKESVSMVLQDISVQKKEEEMLQILAAKEREASELKSKFIVSMSHEIRTPMNGIIGLADIQIQKAHDTAIRDAFKKISLSAKHLLSIVNDILDYSKIEADKLALTREEFVLENIIYESMLTAHEKIGEKQVKMLLRLEPNVPRKVIGDAVRVWQILQNIVDNSAKYTDKGSIVMDVSQEEAGADGQILLFRIADTGKGMNSSQLDKVYVPFEQFHTEDWKNSGTGLGLPITKQLVERMGGTIAIESREGEGTVTEIRIPFGISEWDEPAIEKGDYGILNEKKILLVDEAPVCVQVSCELINSVGAQSEGCYTFAAASARIHQKLQQGEEYDVIVLDQKMDGSLWKDLRKQPYKKTKFITMQQPYKPTQFLERLSALLGGVSQSYKMKNRKYHFPKARILVCEDNAINQDVIMGVLELYGIQAVIAVNGKEGIEWLETDTFHMVIMDIQMPVMDGREATRAIRSSDKAYKDIPIVAMTANAMDEEMASCIQDGMNGYVTKPLELERLYRELLKWLPLSLREETGDGTDQVIRQDKSEGDLYSQQSELEKLGIDVKEATARFAGKYDRFVKSLQKFAADIDKNGMMDIAEAAETEHEELRKYIHGLKGVTANLSIIEDNRMIQEMELTIKEGAPNMGLYQQLHKHLTQLAKDILQAVGQNEEKPLEAGSWDECRPMLVELKELLLKAKARECEQIVGKIREKKWDNVDGELLDKICTSVEEYDYSRTLEILGQIL